MDKKPTVKIHIMHCGEISVSPVVPNGRLSLHGALGGIGMPDERRVSLPVSCYLIEHPNGRLLIDTGISRDMSPKGVFDRDAATALIYPYLADFFRPSVAQGCTVAEKLAAMGLAPEDIDTVMLTHFDPDHTAGLRSLKGAKRILVPQEEYFWSCRTVYRYREPWKLWIDEGTEYFWFKGTGIGPNWWSHDFFGDGTVTFVHLPGHTTGHTGVKVENNGKFVILAADACYSMENVKNVRVPGFGFSKKSMIKSLKWLKKESESPNCLGIIANHDPSVKEGVIEL